MNIFKRIKARLNPPEKTLAALRPELEKLAAGLEQATRDAESDPLSAITSFFSITSVWHDRGLTDIIEMFARVNDGQYDTIIGKLTTLDHQFIKAGRSEYGWNRTKRGEEVTPDRVFLGNVYGLFTHPVPRWQEGKDEPKDSWMGLRDVNSYDVVSDQARRFIMNHAPIMAERARALAAWLNTASVSFGTGADFFWIVLHR